jgi:drug/metabolite transporter (DMT)-like permease
VGEQAQAQGGPALAARPVAAPALLLACSALLFSAMAVLAKRAAARLPGAEVAFVRFAVGCLCSGLVALRGQLRAHNKVGLLLRGVLGGSAVLCYFLAIEHLPVGVATLLNYTQPIFTVFWATLLLREALDVRALGALALTSVGVVLVVRGSNGGSAPLGFGTWELVGLLSAVISGAAVATIREVRRTDGSWEIFAAFCLVGAAITAPPAFAHWVAPSAFEWWVMLLVGGLSVAAQLGMTYSLRFVSAAVAGIISQLTPVGALVGGALVLGEGVSGLAVAGAGTTLMGVSWGAFLAAQPQGPVPDDP